LHTALIITSTHIIRGKAGIQKNIGIPHIKCRAGLVKSGIRNYITLICIKKVAERKKFLPATFEEGEEGVNNKCHCAWLARYGDWHDFVPLLSGMLL
jgi:hypothetical protein